MIIQAEINNYCNGKCIGCYAEKTIEKKTDMKKTEFEKLYSKNFLSRVKKFSLGGIYNEPTLNKEIFGIIKYLKNNKVSVEIITNGNTNNSEFWKELSSVLEEKDQITFVANGITKDTYTTGHGRNLSLAKLFQSVKISTETKGEINFLFNVFYHNREEIEEAENIARKLGCKRFLLNYVDYSERSTLRHIECWLKRRFKDKGWIRCTRIHCSNQEDDSFYIDVYGNVFPCMDWYIFWKWGYNFSNFSINKELEMNLWKNNIESIQKNISKDALWKSNICRDRCCILNKYVQNRNKVVVFD